MTWKEQMKEWGGGEVSFLSEDGEIITFIVVGPPQLIKGKFRGKETVRIGCPVWTEDGFSLLIVGKRVARRLSKYEDKFKTQAFDLIRHGESDDTGTKYELKRCSDTELEKSLFEALKKGVKDIDIKAAVEAAQEIANG